MVAPLNTLNNEGKQKTSDIESAISDENRSEASIEKFESNMDDISKNLLG